MTLGTVKDIPLAPLKVDDAILKDRIRETAIKWVKYYIKEKNKMKSSMGKLYWTGKIEATMEQNDLTKGDLK